MRRTALRGGARAHRAVARPRYPVAVRFLRPVDRGRWRPTRAAGPARSRGSRRDRRIHGARARLRKGERAVVACVSLRDRGGGRGDQARHGGRGRQRARDDRACGQGPRGAGRVPAGHLLRAKRTARSQMARARAGFNRRSPNVHLGDRQGRRQLADPGRTAGRSGHRRRRASPPALCRNDARGGATDHRGLRRRAGAARGLLVQSGAPGTRRVRSGGARFVESRGDGLAAGTRRRRRRDARSKILHPKWAPRPLGSIRTPHRNLT